MVHRASLAGPTSPNPIPTDPHLHLTGHALCPGPHSPSKKNRVTCLFPSLAKYPVLLLSPYLFPMMQEITQNPGEGFLQGLGHGHPLRPGEPGPVRVDTGAVRAMATGMSWPSAVAAERRRERGGPPRATAGGT